MGERKHHYLLCAITCLFNHQSLAFVPSSTASESCCYTTTQHTQQYFYDDVVHKQSFSLFASSADDNNNKVVPSKSSREQGIYSRPSAAIERGSGFFIPGLEGSRIRLLFGLTVLIADAANHILVGSRPGDWGQVVAESLAVFYGALLLLQGGIEVGIERGAAVVPQSNEGITITSSDKNDSILSGYWTSNSRVADDVLSKNDIAIKTIQQMAQTIITFTPSIYFQFVSEESGILYSFGVDDDSDIINNTEQQKQLAKLALDAVSGSKGGRVALPSDHPASKLLPEMATRCILVQKVNDIQGSSRACMIIGSDKLLPSFTKNDLRWIGQLAEYHNMILSKPP